MNKKVLIIIFIIVIVIISIIISIIKSNRKDVSNFNNNVSDDIVTKNDIDNNSINKERSGILNTNINVNINGKIYTANLEQNETARNFVNMLPQEFNMNELNGNEKYIFLENTLPTNSYYPKHIETGDIMLYGNNCLVVFYKSFDTSYSYTKIGHIENLDNLGNDNLLVRFYLN